MATLFLMTINEKLSLKNKVIVLTGGAGQYGRGLAAQIAEAGATLVLASRDVEALRRVAAEEEQRGYSVSAYAFDQGEEQSIRVLRDSILEKYGRIDGLVNNAVYRPAKGAATGSGVQAWEASMKVNGVGLYAITQLFAEQMGAQGSGSIVNIASIYGMAGPSLSLYTGTSMGVGHGDYYFHKGGMINLTRFFAGVWGPRGVRVNCVSPGGFLAQQPKEFLEAYCRQTFLGRMAVSDDLGGPVIFLLSDAAGYVTGANLPVDGGFTAH